MGKDYRRTATDDEVEKMAALVDQGMREGAAGLSSGLEYEVGGYGSTAELIALSEAAARHGGFYMTHVRDEANRTFEAFQEALDIAGGRSCRSRSPTSRWGSSACGAGRRRRST